MVKNLTPNFGKEEKEKAKTYKDYLIQAAQKDPSNYAYFLKTPKQIKEEESEIKQDDETIIENKLKKLENQRKFNNPDRNSFPQGGGLTSS